MSNEARTVETLYEEAKITEDENRVRFEIDGYKFFFNKKAGLMRKRQRAASILQFMSDDLGMAEGKYDDVIEKFIDGVVVTIDEDKKMIGSDISFDDFVATLPEVDDKGGFPQMAMMTGMPYALVFAVMGKVQVSAMMARADTST